MSYRVVYGETRPAWERVFPTRAEANAYAKEQKKVGDTIFSIKKVKPGEPPQSLMAAIEAARKESEVERLAKGTGLTDFRQQLLELADGTRTLQEIADAVKGYVHHARGPSQPSVEVVGSTLSNMRNKYKFDVSWKKPPGSKPGKRPSDKVLASLNCKQAERKITFKKIGETYGVSASRAEQWIKTYRRRANGTE